MWDFDQFNSEHLRREVYYAESDRQIIEVSRTCKGIKEKLLPDSWNYITYEDISIDKGWEYRADIEIKDQLPHIIDMLISDHFLEYEGKKMITEYNDKLHNKERLEKHINDFCQYFKGISYIGFLQIYRIFRYF